MKKNGLLILLLMMVAAPLLAFEKDDVITGSYVYTEPMYNISHGTCDVRDNYEPNRIQLILNKDKTATEFFSVKDKWSGQNPRPLPAEQYTGQWIAKNDTLYVSFQESVNAYLIIDTKLIELIKQKDGSYARADSSKAYRGEYRVFKKEQM